MSSAIMYKFRASTNFESLPMPGTSARLFDVKRAIVRAKKLDKSSGGPQLEFDFSVKNAMTNETYDDESMLLPRGSRLIVQRLPAARGHGLLSKIARADAGISSGAHVAYGNTAAAANGFYTIESHQGEQDEFIDSRPAVNEISDTNQLESADDSEKELRALKAVTDSGGSIFNSIRTSRPAQPGKFGTSVGGVPLPSMSAPPFKPLNNNFHSRPNADPELREQERQSSQAPKKRATGIPRTFLNLTKQPPSDGDGTGETVKGDDNAGGNSLVRLQPNMIGFKALVNRGGGISETGAGGKMLDFDYALKITNKTIPDHLKCGICSQIVKNAMLISWDTEGRTACELCMRDGLAQNGFRCPLTGNEGVSPDELFPNHGLRKAAELFEQDVMKCMREIIEQQEAAVEEEAAAEEERKISTSSRSMELEGDAMDKGLVMSRKPLMQDKKRRYSDDFGEDDFGGDIFDVSEDVVAKDETDSKVVDDKSVTTKKTKKENKNEIVANNSNKSIAALDLDSKKAIIDSDPVDGGSNKGTNNHSKNVVNLSDSQKGSDSQKASDKNRDNKSVPSDNKLAENEKELSQTKEPPPSTKTNRREMLKSRGPPAGYMMGPAGGAVVHAQANRTTPNNAHFSSKPDANNTGNPNGGRGRIGQGNYNNPPDGRGEDMHRNMFDHQSAGRFRGRGRGGGRFHHGQKPPFVQQMGGGGIGRGYRGGFVQTNYQNCGDRMGQHGWRGDNSGRGNNIGVNGEYTIKQDDHHIGSNNSNNQFGNNRPFVQNGKRPRSGSSDQLSPSERYEHTNRGPPDEKVRQFHNKWQHNAGRDNGGRESGGRGRGRGFDQRANGFEHRGRGDFHRGGPGRGNAFSQDRGGRGNFFRGHGGYRRGRF